MFPVVAVTEGLVVISPLRMVILLMRSDNHINSGTVSGNFFARTATYVVKHEIHVKMSSIGFIDALTTSRPGRMMKRSGSGTGLAFSRAPMGCSLARSTNSQLRIRVCSFFLIAWIPSPTQTIDCLDAVKSACGNSKLIMDPVAIPALRLLKLSLSL